MIRVAEPGDREAIISLLVGFSAEAGTKLSLDHLNQGLGPLLQDNQHGVVLVAVSNDEIVGYCVIGWSWGIESGGQEALIDEVFVLNSHRNSGIGSSLIAGALESASERGAKAVFLETENDNPGSRKLYEKHGFNIEHSLWMRKLL
ncbi:MAG: GNAT family N-acetyltransferase [Aquiluna sp.]|nr:GNAT family N-acetyltransferase [Aquiluna sp.]